MERLVGREIRCPEEPNHPRDGARRVVATTKAPTRPVDEGARTGVQAIHSEPAHHAMVTCPPRRGRRGRKQGRWYTGRGMTPPPESLVQYRSGTDVTLTFGRFRFQFAMGDFAHRADAAAVALGFVDGSARNGDELADLATLASHGVIATPRSPLGAHLAGHQESLVDRDGDVVHWLRRLIFRGAWLDQQINEGRIDPVFDAGFQYCSATSGEPVAAPVRLPDWSALRFGTQPA